MTLYLETLPSKPRNILLKLKGIIRSHHFVLAGGTGLALQLGHRLSIDLDFFTSRSFNTETLFQKIKRLKLSPIVQQEEEGTLTVMADGVKISFLYYPYRFIEKRVSFNRVPIASIVDIASMKVIAINQRGAKRDFIDLYFILQNIPFWKIAENMVGRFGKKRINPVQFGKSLVFFNDAEGDPDPVYCGKKGADWKMVKKFFMKNVHQMVLDLSKTPA